MNQVKQFAFKCFIFNYQRCFQSLSLEAAATLFELDKRTINKIACKLIYSKKLNAALDLASGCIIFYREEATPFQEIGIQLLNAIQAQVLVNEKLLDKKGGIYGFQDQEQPAFVRYGGK